MASLRKRNGIKGYVYYIDFVHEGRRFTKSTLTSDIKVAKKIKNDIEGKIARGAFDFDQYDKKHILLSKFFDDYFEYVKSFKKKETIYNEKIISKQFVASVGDCDLRKVDLQKIDMWKSKILENQTATTFNIKRRFLHAAFNVAIKWGYIDKNSMKNVMKEKPIEKRLYFKSTELTAVFKLLDADIVATESELLQQFRNYIEFLLLTGLRRSEAINLHLSDIDHQKNEITIKKTKTKLIRIIPLHPRAKQILLDQGDKVFSELRQEYVTKKFFHYVDTAELTDLKLHSLRHTFATNLIEKGVDIYTVSRLLGHTDISTTMVYAKVNTQTMQTAIAKLGS